MTKVQRLNNSTCWKGRQINFLYTLVQVPTGSTSNFNTRKVLLYCDTTDLERGGLCLPEETLPVVPNTGISQSDTAEEITTSTGRRAISSAGGVRPSRRRRTSLRRSLTHSSKFPSISLSLSLSASPHTSSRLNRGRRPASSVIKIHISLLRYLQTLFMQMWRRWRRRQRTRSPSPRCRQGEHVLQRPPRR